jgi:UDP-2-acetamido-3-amino-2,3-dideoxy-glucuronate N-acetyltransferase
MSYFLHPSAIIDAPTQIGDGTKIWHFSHVMSGCVIGTNCILGQNVFIDANVVLGNGVKVQNNVSIYNGVICQNDVFIGPSAVFTNVINPRSAVERKHEFKQTLVMQGATIGANATIVCGVTIGKYAFIGAGAVVTKNVADYALITGSPGKQTGWMSEFGEKLNFDADGKAICLITNDVYILANKTVKKVV